MSAAEFEFEVSPIERTLGPFCGAAHITTRDITPDECPWLAEVVLSGTVVYRFLKPTYGAVKDFAATLDPDGDYPFFELPWDAVEVSQ